MALGRDGSRRETCVGKSRCCLLVDRVASLKTERFTCLARGRRPADIGTTKRHRLDPAIDVVLCESAWRAPFSVC